MLEEKGKGNSKEEKKQKEKQEKIIRLINEKIPEEIKEDMEKNSEKKDNSNLDEVSVTSDIEGLEIIDGKVVMKEDETK